MRERILYYAMPVLKLLLFLTLCFFCFLPTPIIVQFSFIQQVENLLIADLIVELGLCLAVFGALLMVLRILRQYSLYDVFIIPESSISGFLKGSLIGLCLISACVGFVMLNGNVVFSSGNISIITFFGYLIFFILVAIFEELLFRTFPLLVFAERYHIAIAIFLSSVLFGLAHLGNNGFTWLAMLNITLAGILFSIFTLQKWNISWAIGIHFGWNFTQGTILGYQVSGGKSSGILISKPVGETYLSGGIFGIEGSVFCTAILIIVITFLVFKYKIEPVQEILLEEPEEEETI
ncbi:CPBP family intramembrane glutamic endopeptidase [Pedobacter frigiditerrae]|uniref:CPBP family intramembrane glutamic endopeptidase n=1 Tax=Pedobacter frigiditerrae TaxID=2530452 RepID=UPI00292D3CE1|nr:CPBP family intramembrane glutamic endopeptidase [Pedobacter frigiditerrae]